MGALRQVTASRVLAGHAQNEARSRMAIICGLSSIYVANHYQSSLHSLDLESQWELTPDKEWWLRWRLVSTRRIYFLPRGGQPGQVTGQPTQDPLDASICALAFLTACGLYAMSFLYLAGQDYYKHSPSIRRCSILLGCLACLVNDPRSKVFGSLIYQYIPLAALAAAACGKYLSHGRKGCHEASRRETDDNKGSRVTCVKEDILLHLSPH